MSKPCKYCGSSEVDELPNPSAVLVICRKCGRSENREVGQ